MLECGAWQYKHGADIVPVTGEVLPGDRLCEPSTSALICAWAAKPAVNTTIPQIENSFDFTA
jgi:hypothetical protein